jgi:hypothetical protein
MPFYPARYGDGAGASTLKTLNTVLAAAKVKHFKQLSLRAAKSNTGTVFVGGSTLTTAGVGAGIVLDAGESFTIGPADLTMDFRDAYIIGTDGNQIAYLSLFTHDRLAGS